MITQDQLDALPEQSSGFGQIVRTEPDGRKVCIPVWEGPVGCMFQGPDDALLIEDRQGRVWTTGWISGVLYKRRMTGYE